MKIEIPHSNYPQIIAEFRQKNWVLSHKAANFSRRLRNCGLRGGSTARELDFSAPGSVAVWLSRCWLCSKYLCWINSL